MTLLQQITKSSTQNVRRLLTHKSSSSLILRSRHILANSTIQQNQHEKRFRYVSIPPNSGSGASATATASGINEDDPYTFSDVDFTGSEFNEEDFFKSTDMEFYDDSNLSSSSASSPSLDSIYDSTPRKTSRELEEEKDYERRQAIRDEIDSRTGRLWEDPWALTDEDWSSGKTLDDLPEWTEQICSRISKERVKVHPGKLFLILLTQHKKTIF